MSSHFDVIIIGAGAAGLMCGAMAGTRGKSVLIIDHADKPAEKIRILGGSRCNLTNFLACCHVIWCKKFAGYRLANIQY